MYGSVGQRGKIPECFADDFTDMYCTASGFPPFLSTSRKIVSIDR